MHFASVMIEFSADRLLISLPAFYPCLAIFHAIHVLLVSLEHSVPRSVSKHTLQSDRQFVTHVPLTFLSLSSSS